MKFKILQQDLYSHLAGVARSCGIKSQLPVLNNILLSTEGASLQLSATNLEIGVVKSIKAEVLEEGAITVPSKTLVDIISNLSGEMIEFTSNSDQLQIETASFSSQINGISATEFPTIPLAGQKSVSIDPQILSTALPQVSFAAAVDDGRPILTGILTEINDKKLELVATDGYRLAHKSVDVEEEVSFKALVPKRTFEEVLRLIAEGEGESVEISTSENQNQIIFQYGSTKISSRLIEGQFPAWEKIVPKETKMKIEAEKSEMIKAVKLASVFSKTESNVVKLTKGINGDHTKLILSSEAKELGSQHKQIDAIIDGEDIEIAFNARFLQDALTACSGNRITMQLSGNLSAAIMRPVGDNRVEYVIMPVNLG